MEAANEIITTAIEALRGEAQAIEAKIAALESSLSLAVQSETPRTPRRGNSKKTSSRVSLKVAPKKKTRAKVKERSTTRTKQTKDKLQTAAEKRSKSWDAAKKAAAAERMRKYWAQRKKQG
ncbi:MAG: hypothetical protein KTR25_20010 [Myxococcales bacterium]|nr:hypothetical protein [Myxococcales bacterium]